MIRLLLTVAPASVPMLAQAQTSTQHGHSGMQHEMQGTGPAA